jgi:hypothetical protein
MLSIKSTWYEIDILSMVIFPHFLIFITDLTDLRISRNEAQSAVLGSPQEEQLCKTGYEIK